MLLDVTYDDCATERYQLLVRWADGEPSDGVDPAAVNAALLLRDEMLRVPVVRTLLADSRVRRALGASRASIFGVFVAEGLGIGLVDSILLDRDVTAGQAIDHRDDTGDLVPLLELNEVPSIAGFELDGAVGSRGSRAELSRLGHRPCRANPAGPGGPVAAGRPRR